MVAHALLRRVQVAVGVGSGCGGSCRAGGAQVGVLHTGSADGLRRAGVVCGSDVPCLASGGCGCRGR